MNIDWLMKEAFNMSFNDSFYQFCESSVEEFEEDIKIMFREKMESKKMETFDNQENTYRGDWLNLYAYCDNNPVMYYDPSGHMALGYDDDYNEAGKIRVAELNDNNSNINGSGKGIKTRVVVGQNI